MLNRKITIDGPMAGELMDITDHLVRLEETIGLIRHKICYDDNGFWIDCRVARRECRELLKVLESLDTSLETMRDRHRAMAQAERDAELASQDNNIVKLDKQN